MAETALKRELPLILGGGAVVVVGLWLASSQSGGKGGRAAAGPYVVGGQQAAPSRSYSSSNTGGSTAAALLSTFLQGQDETQQAEIQARSEDYIARQQAKLGAYQSYMGTQGTEFTAEEQAQMEYEQLSAEEQMFQEQISAQQPQWWQYLLGGLSSVGSFFSGGIPFSSLFGGASSQLSGQPYYPNPLDTLGSGYALG